MIDLFRTSAVQIRRHGPQFCVYVAFFYVFLLFFVLFPSLAQASTARSSAVHKIEFNETAQDPIRTLDWRNPATVLTFDVPDNDWVDDVELLLSARPLSPVNPGAPLLVRFNDAAPIPVDTGGNGFDARIRLDRMRIRSERNQVSFEYQVPAGAACLTAGHGAWDIDAGSSVVVVTSRPKSRPLSFHDVKVRMSAPSTAPKSVALLAKGPQALKLQALAAQGMMRNIDDIPNFRINRGSADLEIVMATRANLKGWVKDKDVLGGMGASIALGSAKPLQIVLTGDTDAEVMEAAKAFASYAIPVSYSRDVTPLRFISTAPTFTQIKRIKGKTKLAELGAAPFIQSWAPRPQQILFDIADPAASFGTLSLQIQAGSFVDPASTLSASLNGEPLGSVQIARSKMNAKFDIPRGVLQGLSNRLTLTPNLQPSTEKSACAATRIGPGFSIGPKSHIKIRSDFASDATDLSRFSASGLPFAGHDNAMPTHVILATQNQAENRAAFKLLAQLGRASKTGWGEAVFHSGTMPQWPETGNILLIGSQVDVDAAILSGAPKGLKVAMGGTYKQDAITTKSARNAGDMPVLLASQSPIEGGVAALYRDTNHPERIIGIITQTRGQSFVRAIDDLLSTGHWNDLEGSVARWNRDIVEMAQTSMSAPGTASSFSFAPKMPAFKRPDINLPDMSPFFAGVSAKWSGFTGWVGGFFTPKPDLPLPASLPAMPHPESIPPASTAIDLRPTRPQVPQFIPPAAPKHSSRAAPDIKRPMVRNEQPRLAEPTPSRTGLSLPSLPDGRLTEMGHKAGSAYTSASAQVTDVMSHSRLGQYRTSKKYESKYVLLAIICTIMLLMAVFISPEGSRLKPRDQA